MTLAVGGTLNITTTTTKRGSTINRLRCENTCLWDLWQVRRSEARDLIVLKPTLKNGELSYILLFRLRITKALIRLLRCAVWPVYLFFASNKVRVSRFEDHILMLKPRLPGHRLASRLQDKAQTSLINYRDLLKSFLSLHVANLAIQLSRIFNN